ncbi:hypothetical protein HanHA300_Chr09g0303281 [Helianthus annuus]|nr:hypothetical protein HanHA300_Chr09g0303281 [Helianthus annuus]KAJ0710172.1 hypothetical protein HanOQP8_Chr09g0309261 [Helianthus annuus]
MHYRSESEGIPRVNVSIPFTEQDWYTTLTWKVTPIVQMEERALVVAGMSILWAPQNPRGFRFMDTKGKVLFLPNLLFASPFRSLHTFLCFAAGYSLMNIFDPKAGGGMVVAVLPEGRPLRVDQIRDNFLHPTSESMATYTNVVLGEDGGDKTDVDPAPTREEPIILSSEESADSCQGLIHRSTRVGP